MSKKQKQTPLFLVFANLDLDSTGRTGWNPSQWSEHIRKVVHKSSKNYPIYKNRFKQFLAELPQKDIDITHIVHCHEIIRNLLGELTTYKNPRIISYLSENLADILQNVKPHLKWSNNQFVLTTINPNRDFASDMCFEMARFLEDHYKKGRFAKCMLKDCNQIILTWNNIKYCSGAHKSKAYDQSISRDPKKQEYRQIKDKLNKRYHRELKAGAIPKKKYPEFKYYKTDKWPLDKMALLNLFTSAK